MAKAKDRWERIANKAVAFEKVGSEQEAWVLKSDVANLLRQQHRAVIRIVKQELTECESMERKLFASETERANWYGWNCRSAQCRQILDHLARRAR